VARPRVSAAGCSRPCRLGHGVTDVNQLPSCMCRQQFSALYWPILIPIAPEMLSRQRMLSRCSRRLLRPHSRRRLSPWRAPAETSGCAAPRAFRQAKGR
jgi:hypothetical protein